MLAPAVASKSVQKHALGCELSRCVGVQCLTLASSAGTIDDPVWWSNTSNPGAFVEADLQALRMSAFSSGKASHLLPFPLVPKEAISLPRQLEVGLDGACFGSLQ